VFMVALRSSDMNAAFTPYEEPARPLSVVLAVRDFLALLEPVFFGLVIGNFCGRRGLLAILRVMVGVFVVGVLLLGVGVGAGCHGCESCLPVPGTQPRGPRGVGQSSVGESRAWCNPYPR
jgi:hypothetical protein